MNTLTRNGVVELLECRSCTLQIKDIAEARKQDKRFIVITFSDGRYSIKNNVLAQPLESLGVEKAQELRFAVVKILKAKTLQNKRTGYKSASVQKMQVVSREQEEIGKPQPYDSSKPLIIEEQEKVQAPPKKNNTSLPKPKSTASHTIEQFVSAPVNQQAQNKKANRSHSNPPIVKAQPRPKSRDIEKSQAGYLTPISDLFPNMDGWTIRVRLFFKSDVKTIRTKKGTDTEIFTVILMDKDESLLYGASFGETATKLSTSLNINDIYEIRNAQVQEELKSKPNSNIKVKLNLGDRTVINETEDDGTIPLIEDKCKSVRELVESTAGSFVNIVCLIKEAGELNHFTSKAGKPCVKRVIKVCDPVEKVSTDITLWGDFVNYPFETVPYAIYNIQAREFNGNVSFSTGFESGIVPLKDHKFKRYKDLSKIVFSDTKANTTSAVRKTIHEVKVQSDELTDDLKIWSEIRGYVAFIRTTGTMWYLSCPKCKKKVTSQTNSSCLSCGESYDYAKYRYILNIQLADDTGSLWASVHNEQAEQILENRTADDLQKMDPEDLKNLCNDMRDKEVVCNISTKLEKFQGISKPRHSISKLKKLDFAEEAKLSLKFLLQKLK